MSLDMPKSEILTQSSPPTRQLRVARSRCTKCLDERYIMPRAICSAVSIRSACGADKNRDSAKIHQGASKGDSISVSVQSDATMRVGVGVAVGF